MKPDNQSITLDQIAHDQNILYIDQANPTIYIDHAKLVDKKLFQTISLNGHHAKIFFLAVPKQYYQRKSIHVTNGNKVEIEGSDFDEILTFSHIKNLHIQGRGGNENFILDETVEKAIIDLGKDHDCCNSKAKEAIILGGDGHDRITIMAGSGYFSGGKGNDSIIQGYKAHETFLLGDEGDDIITFQESVYVDGGLGDDNIIQTYIIKKMQRPSFIFSGPGCDEISVKEGYFTIDGGKNSDRIVLSDSKLPATVFNINTDSDDQFILSERKFDPHIGYKLHPYDGSLSWQKKNMVFAFPTEKNVNKAYTISKPLDLTHFTYDGRATKLNLNIEKNNLFMRTIKIDGMDVQVPALKHSPYSIAKPHLVPNHSTIALSEKLKTRTNFNITSFQESIQHHDIGFQFKKIIALESPYSPIILNLKGESDIRFSKNFDELYAAFDHIIIHYIEDQGIKLVEKKIPYRGFVKNVNPMHHTSYSLDGRIQMLNLKTFIEKGGLSIKDDFTDEAKSKIQFAFYDSRRNIATSFSESPTLLVLKNLKRK